MLISHRFIGLRWTMPTTWIISPLWEGSLKSQPKDSNWLVPPVIGFNMVDASSWRCLLAFLSFFFSLASKLRPPLNPSSFPGGGGRGQEARRDATGVVGCVGGGEASGGGAGRGELLVALGGRLLRAGAPGPRAQGRRVYSPLLLTCPPPTLAWMFSHIGAPGSAQFLACLELVWCWICSIEWLQLLPICAM